MQPTIVIGRAFCIAKAHAAAASAFRALRLSMILSFHELKPQTFQQTWYGKSWKRSLARFPVVPELGGWNKKVCLQNAIDIPSLPH